MLSSTADEVLATTRTVRGVTSHPPGRLAEAMISVRPGAAQVGSEGHGVLPCRRTGREIAATAASVLRGTRSRSRRWAVPAISRRPDLRVMGVHPAVTSRLRSTTDHALLARRVAARLLVRRRGGSDRAAAAPVGQSLGAAADSAPGTRGGDHAACNTGPYSPTPSTSRSLQRYQSEHERGSKPAVASNAKRRCGALGKPRQLLSERAMRICRAAQALFG